MRHPAPTVEPGTRPGSRYPLLVQQPHARTWLAIQSDLGLAHNTIDAYNVLAITEFGGRAGKVREPGLCDQVLGSAFQACFGEEAHSDPFDKASVILRRLIAGHPFEDGNKRTGFLTVYYDLEQVGYPPTGRFLEEDVVRFCFAISAGDTRDLGASHESVLTLWGYVEIGYSLGLQ